MPLGVIRSQVSRRYGNFRGIDLLNPEASIIPQRSPDCLNVWKSYDTEQSNIIQSRPGIKEYLDVSDAQETNNNIYTLFNDKGDILIHKGKNLIKDGNSPTTLYSLMAQHKSEMVHFRDRVQIIDGTHYLNYNGITVADNVGNGTIPTTTIGRSPARWWRNVSRCKPSNK